MRLRPRVGPVFAFELITTARRGRYYAARVVYGLILLYTFSAEYDRMAGMQRDFLSIKRMGQFAESAFIAFSYGQGVVLLALIPAMVAGVVADEHQRKTLHYLLASELTSSEIVLGKLGARLIHAGVFVLMGLPVVCLIGMYGGLDPWYVLYVYGGTASMALFLAGLSMLASVVARRPRDAILLAYGLEAAWLLLTPVVASLAGYFTPAVALWLVPLSTVAMLSHPWHAWRLMSHQQDILLNMNGGNARWAAGWIATMASELHTTFLWMFAIQMVLGGMFLALAVTLLRPLRGGARGRRRAGYLARRREREAIARPGCGDHPMLWKERFAARGGGLAWLTSLPVVLVLGTALGCYLFDAAWPAVRSLVVGNEGDRPRVALNGELRTAGAFLFTLWLVGVASAASVAVTSEREEDSWTSLTASLLTGREIVLAKMFGAAWGARRMGFALLAVWGVGLLSGAVHPLGFLLAVLGLAIYTWFATALGVRISLTAKNSTRALFGTIVALLAVNVGYLPLLHAVVPGPDSALTFVGVSPAVEGAALLSYADVGDLWEGRPFPPGSGLHNTPQPLMWFSFSLTLYALGALALTHSALRAFDVAVDRPRRDEAGMATPGGIPPRHRTSDEIAVGSRT